MKKLRFFVLLAMFGVAVGMSAQTTLLPQTLSPLVCQDTSGSGAVQSCSTTPSFTISAGNTIIYETTTTNTGDLTIAVNGGAAVHARKWQGTYTLAAGDLVSGVYMLATYDGTYWEFYTIANDPALVGPSAVDQFNLKDDFCGGLAVEGLVGNLGWFTDQLGTAIWIRDTGPDVNHPCGITFTTSAGATDFIASYLTFCGNSAASQSCTPGTPTANSLPPLGSMTFDATYVGKLNSITTVDGHWGFYDWSFAADGHIELQYDSTVTGNYEYHTRNDSGTDNLVNSGVAAVAGRWFKVRIRSTTAGTILFSMCQGASATAGCVLGAETAVSTDIPLHALTPEVGLFNDGATSHSMLVDYFSFDAVLTR